eukprot:GHVT01079342.1.p2 GENE.GHVT01079342.1~~GHVT01079342.1.p2  ORF type:complete len:126 (+),score=20.07 GHVT01079342.1:3194-3571(+)
MWEGFVISSHSAVLGFLFYLGDCHLPNSASVSKSCIFLCVFACWVSFGFPFQIAAQNAMITGTREHSLIQHKKTARRAIQKTPAIKTQKKTFIKTVHKAFEDKRVLEIQKAADAKAAALAAIADD